MTAWDREPSEEVSTKRHEIQSECTATATSGAYLSWVWTVY